MSIFPSIFSNSGTQPQDQPQQLSVLLENSNVRLSRIVKERMPMGTYTDINVRTVQYSFSGMYESGIEARVITLSVSKVHGFVE